MKSCVFLILLISTCTLAQTNNDIFSTDIDTPFCVPLLANDNVGSTLNAVENATEGFAFLNHPPFYLGNNSQSGHMISIQAQGAHVLNFGSTNVSSAYLDTGDSWNFSTYRNLSVIASGPDDGNNTGNAFWGVAMGYNIAIYEPGSYAVWVYASSGTNGASSDSCHFLAKSPLNDTIKFLSSPSPPSSFTDNFIWKTSSVRLNVSAEEAAWPPSLFTFYLALREDGLMIHQFVLSQNTSSPVGNPYLSPEISCNPLTEALYYPPKNFSGVDTFTYTVTDGSGTYNSTATVYVGVPIPSPSPTPTSSPSASSTPSPSSSPSSSPSTSYVPSPSPVPSPSAGASTTDGAAGNDSSGSAIVVDLLLVFVLISLFL